MKQIRLLAQYYVDLMMKLGLVRFSMLLALALVVLAIVVQMAVTMVLHGQVESIDVIRSIFFGLLITPWAVYFLSVVVEQLEESRHVCHDWCKTGGDARARFEPQRSVKR